MVAVLFADNGGQLGPDSTNLILADSCLIFQPGQGGRGLDELLRGAQKKAQVPKS